MTFWYSGNPDLTCWTPGFLTFRYFENRYLTFSQRHFEKGLAAPNTQIPHPPTPRAQARPGPGAAAPPQQRPRAPGPGPGRAWALGVGGVGYLGIWGSQTVFKMSLKMSNTGFQNIELSRIQDFSKSNPGFWNTRMSRFRGTKTNKQN